MRTFRGDQARVEMLRRGALARGRTVLIVDGAGDRQLTLEAFGRDLGFPDYYGANYDALVDCLRDLADPQSRPITVIWDRAGTLRDRDRQAFEVIEDILRCVDAERADLSVAVVVR